MKRNLKTVCALSLTGLLLFSLNGCGGNTKETAKPGTQKLTIYWGALEDFLAADVAELLDKIPVHGHGEPGDLRLCLGSLQYVYLSTVSYRHFFRGVHQIVVAYLDVTALRSRSGC